MPIVTKISLQTRRSNRRNIFLDGRFAFACNLNVVAKFRLREGINLSADEVSAIQRGELRQECFDQAIKFLERRLHSRTELFKKLNRKEYAEPTINSVLDDLARLGYVSDERFARTKALSAAQHKHHGRGRAYLELIKAGVSSDIARCAVDDVYETTDTIGLARQLALIRAPRLKRLEPLVARRRLIGLLQRRGFNYDDIRPVIEEVLGEVEERQYD